MQVQLLLITVIVDPKGIQVIIVTTMCIVIATAVLRMVTGHIRIQLGIAIDLRIQADIVLRAIMVRPIIAQVAEVTSDIRAADFQ